MDCIIYLYTAHLLYSVCVPRNEQLRKYPQLWSQTRINDGVNIDHWESRDKIIYSTLMAWPDLIFVIKLVITSKDGEIKECKS